jgi:hypothetical protein
MRNIARDEYSQVYLPTMTPVPLTPTPTPMRTTSGNQVAYDYSYNNPYRYVDCSAWEDNSPAVITRGQWKDHTQTAKSAYDSSQANGEKVGEVKSAITSEIQETRKLINETHDSVHNTETRIKDTRDAIDLAHVSVKSTHTAVKEAQAAVQKTQDAILGKQAAHMSKQEECAAEITRVRQLLEEELNKREEARRLREMVQYVQNQAQLDRVRDACNHSSSSSRTNSASPSRSSERQRRSHADEEQEAERRRKWEREREEFEKQQQAHQVQYSEALREFTDKQQRLQEEQERLIEGEFERLRIRDPYFHHPRPRDMYYDDVVEVPPYNEYSYAEDGVGGSVRDRAARPHQARRRQPRRENGRPASWQYTR